MQIAFTFAHDRGAGSGQDKGLQIRGCKKGLQAGVQPLLHLVSHGPFHRGPAYRLSPAGLFLRHDLAQEKDCILNRAGSEPLRQALVPERLEAFLPALPAVP